MSRGHPHAAERNRLNFGCLPKVVRKQPGLLNSSVLKAAGRFSCLLLLLQLQIVDAHAQPDSPAHHEQAGKTPDGRAQELPDAPMPKMLDLRSAFRQITFPKTPGLVPCHTVFVSSDSRIFPASDLQLEALFAPEFINKEYILVAEPERADALVDVSSSDDSGDQDGTDLLLMVEASDRQREYFLPNVDNARQIVHEILVLLSSLCRTAASYEAENGVQSRTKLSLEEVSAKLQAVTCVRAISQTSLMDVKQLARELAQRPEFVESGIKVTSVKGPGCVDVVAKRQLSTRTWTYQLDEQQTGAALDSGAVFVFEDRRAASRIAAAVAKQLTSRRPRPASSSSTVRSAAGSLDRLQIPGSWRIRVLQEGLVGKRSKELRLTLDGGRLVAKTKGGEVVFAIPARDLVDVTIEKRRGMPLSAQMPLDVEEVDGLNLENGCADQGCAFVGAAEIAMIVTLWTFDGIGSMIAHLKHPKHILHVAWRENGETRTAEWSMSKGDWQALGAALEGVLTEHIQSARSADEDHEFEAIRF